MLRLSLRSSLAVHHLNLTPRKSYPSQSDLRDERIVRSRSCAFPPEVRRGIQRTTCLEAVGPSKDVRPCGVGGISCYFIVEFS
jgi:hypothetical protein